MTILDKLFKSSKAAAEKHEHDAMLDLLEAEFEEQEVEKAGLGSGFSSGRGIGEGLDRPGGAASATASAVPSAVSTLTGGGSRSPRPAAAKPAQAVGAPAAPATTAAGPASPAQNPNSGAREIAMSVKKGCSVCNLEKCTCGMNKAMNSRSLSIPVHMRQPHNTTDIQRSATSQTTAMYTALAKPVQETLDYVSDTKDGDKLRADAVKSQEDNSKRIQELREKLNSAMVPRAATRFDKNSR